MTTQEIQLFVSSEDEQEAQFGAFLREWTTSHPTVRTEIVPILRQPEKVVRLQIKFTPALVVDGAVVAQGFALDQLQPILEQQIPSTNE